MIGELIGFDYLLIGVLGISALISLFRGFFREALSLATWIAAVWMAWRFGPQGAALLEAWITPDGLRVWVARALIVVAVLILGGLLGAALRIVIASTGLTGTDRAIGMVFGLARGVLIAGVVLVVMEEAGFGETAWWPESVLVPYFAPVTDMIRHAAGDGLRLLEEVDLGGIG